MESGQNYTGKKDIFYWILQKPGLFSRREKFPTHKTNVCVQRITQGDVS